MAKNGEKPAPFEQVIVALLDEAKAFPARFIYRLSDLVDAELVQLENVWAQVPLRRRQAVLEDVEEFNSDFVLNFYDIAKLASQDQDASVRLMAIRTLSEYEDEELIPLFIQVAEQDADGSVRSAAAAALGHFIYLGELEEIPETSLHQVEDCLLRVYIGEDDKPIRIKALEALGFSSRSEVPGLIEAAYHSDDEEWVASALIAMGRSYNQAYRDHVMESLTDDRLSVLAEAITAAGELELPDAIPFLLETLKDEDDNLRRAAIWAVSQIGGDNVRDALEHMLDETEDEVEADFLEGALENLEFTEGLAGLAMLEFDEDDLDDLIDDEDIEED